MMQFANDFPDKKIVSTLSTQFYKQQLSDFGPQELVDTLLSAEDIEKRIMNKYEIEDDKSLS